MSEELKEVIGRIETGGYGWDIKLSDLSPENRRRWEIGKKASEAKAMKAMAVAVMAALDSAIPAPVLLRFITEGFEIAYAAALAAAKTSGDHPQIVCLCGSTRFTDIMQVKAWELSKAGYIIVTWGVVPDWYYSGPHIGDHEGVKGVVDELHKRKIDLCDFVLVIDVEGYIGESTRSEIDYAEKHGKPVKYLSKAEPEYVENLRKKFLAATPSTPRSSWCRWRRKETNHDA